MQDVAARVIENVPQEPRLRPDRSVLETVREGLRAHSEVVAALAEPEASLATLEGERLDAALHEQAALHRRVLDLGGWDRDHEVRGIATAPRRRHAQEGRLSAHRAAAGTSAPEALVGRAGFV